MNDPSRGIVPGNIYVMYAQSNNLGNVKIIGIAESVVVDLRDGHGYERRVKAEVVVPATDAEIAAYWRDRAMQAERSLNSFREAERSEKCVTPIDLKGNPANDRLAAEFNPHTAEFNATEKS